MVGKEDYFLGGKNIELPYILLTSSDGKDNNVSQMAYAQSDFHNKHLLSSLFHPMPLSEYTKCISELHWFSSHSIIASLSIQNVEDTMTCCLATLTF